MTTDNRFIKDPDAVLDWKFDWAALTNGSGSEDWLRDGETISTHTVTVATGLTKDSSSLADTNTSVIVWLSGGTVNTKYAVTCQIVTTVGRTDERTIYIQVMDR